MDIDRHNDNIGGLILPLHCLDVYDNAGGVTVTATAKTLNLDTTRKSVGDSLSVATDIITADKAGLYLVTFRISCDLNTGTTRSSYMAWLEQDPAGGGSFAEIDGSRCFGYTRVIGEENSSATATILWDAAITDELRVRFIETAAPASITLADASGITLVRIG